MGGQNLRETLGTSRIFFCHNPAKINPVPRHIDSLRVALLDFGLAVPDRPSRGTGNKVKAVKRTDFAGIDMSEVEHAEIWKILQDDAKRLLAGPDRDTEWENYFMRWFLEPLRESTTKMKCGDLRRVSRMKYYLDHFEVTCNQPWTFFTTAEEGYGQQAREYLNSGPLPVPVPAWSAHFPVYDLWATNRVPLLAGRTWGSAPRQNLADNFSRPILKHLEGHGLATSVFQPVGGMYMLDNDDRTCFPWLIVEHKREDEQADDKSFYHLAATAALKALAMLQILAKHAENKSQDRHVPPVTVITTAGENVQVWIAYVSDGGKSEQMKCIWSGNMTNLVDIFKFQAILENCHAWAMRELRPWVSQYIDQWRYRCGPECASGFNDKHGDGATQTQHLATELTATAPPTPPASTPASSIPTPAPPLPEDHQPERDTENTGEASVKETHPACRSVATQTDQPARRQWQVKVRVRLPKVAPQGWRLQQQDTSDPGAPNLDAPDPDAPGPDARGPDASNSEIGNSVDRPILSAADLRSIRQRKILPVRGLLRKKKECGVSMGGVKIRLPVLDDADIIEASSAFKATKVDFCRPPAGKQPYLFGASGLESPSSEDKTSVDGDDLKPDGLAGQAGPGVTSAPQNSGGVGKNHNGNDDEDEWATTDEGE